MDKLLKCRKEIDKIDNEIINLYEKRMSVVEDVIIYKIENLMPIEDKSREKAMLEKNLPKIKNEKYKKYYEHVLNGYLNASKKMQEEIINKK